MTHEAVAVTTEHCVLGEGARWDERRGESLRVDIVAGRVFRDAVVADGSLVPVDTYQVPGTVGAIAPVFDDDGWVLAGSGFAYQSPDGTGRPLVDVAAPRTRINDDACDPQGRFWAGTLADDHYVGGGALYRLDRDGRTELVLGGLTIAKALSGARRQHDVPGRQRDAGGPRVHVRR